MTVIRLTQMVKPEIKIRKNIDNVVWSIIITLINMVCLTVFVSVASFMFAVGVAGFIVEDFMPLPASATLILLAVIFIIEAGRNILMKTKYEPLI